MATIPPCIPTPATGGIDHSPWPTRAPQDATARPPQRAPEAAAGEPAGKPGWPGFRLDMDDYSPQAKAYWWVTTVLGACVLGLALAQVAALESAALLQVAEAVRPPHLDGGRGVSFAQPPRFLHAASRDFAADTEFPALAMPAFT